MEKNTGNRKRNGTGFSENPVVRAFQAAWIWFKETAWVQVILVVLIVFGIVFSIPYIVAAATANPDTSEINLKYLKGKRKNYNDLNNIVKDGNRSQKYTVVFYYSEADDTSKVLANYLRTAILAKGENYYQSTLDASLYTLDLSRTEKADSDDYDVTTAQLTDLANVYKPFYMSSIYEKAFYDNGTISNAPLYTADWDSKGNSDGVLTVPANTWVIYENGSAQGLMADPPVWISLGFNTVGSSGSTVPTAFLREFAAALNYNTDPDIVNLQA